MLGAVYSTGATLITQQIFLENCLTYGNSVDKIKNKKELNNENKIMEMVRRIHSKRFK